MTKEAKTPKVGEDSQGSAQGNRNKSFVLVLVLDRRNFDD